MKSLQNLSYKTLFTILFLSLAGIVFFLKIGGKTQKVSAAWWDEMWHYRQSISVFNNTSFDATDIPYKITLDTASLITVGKLQVDADDIRIVDQNGKIVRSQVEKSTLNTTTTKIWFEVTVKSNSTNSYYIYYGNPSVTAPIFESNINSVTSTTNDVTIEMKDGFGYSTTAYVGRISDIRKNGNNLGVDGNINASSAYSNYWWTDYNFNQTILNSTGPLFVEINYSNSNRSVYSSYGTNIKIFNNGFAETRMFVTYNTSGSDNFYYYLSFDTGTRNSVWVNGSGTLVDQDADSGNLTESSLGQNWFGQRWTSTGNYGGTIITKNGSDWVNGATSTRASYYQTNYSYNQSYTSGSSREVRFGVFAGNGGLSEMTQKGANYGALTSSSSSEETGGGPIAYWKFDEGVGTTAYDSAGANNGIISGATYTDETQCISGKCLKFDGNDILSSTGSPTNNPTRFTVSAWVKLNRFNPTTGNIGSVIFTNYGSAAKGLIFYIYDDGRIGARVHDGVSGHDLKSVNTLKLNQWTYITTTYDGTYLKVFLNGNQENVITSSSAMNNNTAYIGSWLTNAYTDGFIDDVKIYPYARTADQIKQDYNSRGSASSQGSSVNLGSNKNSNSLSDGLVGYWKMDEGVGTTTLDSSGNNNTGTLAGTTLPTWSNGKYGVGVTFNGSNSYINFGNPGLSSLTNATISFWRKAVNSNSWLLFRGQDNNYYVMATSGAGNFYHSNIGSATKIYIDGNLATAPLTDNNWHHYIITGVNLSTWTTLTLSNYTNYHYNGSIDELRIYNRSLNYAEVSALYNYAPGPIGYWDFNEKTGTIAQDKSGNGLNGTISGTTWAQGKIGGALNFSNASNDKISVNTPLIIGTGDFTTEAWIKRTGTSTDYIIGNYGTGGCSSGFEFYAQNSVVGLYINGYVWDTQTITTNTWYHVTATRENGNIKIFINGNVGATGTLLSNIGGNCNLTVGNGPNYTSENFNGSIDEVKIYNYARTQKQIIEDMNAGAPAASSKSMIAHYKFDEGSGTTVYNSGNAGSSLNGTFGTGDSAPSWTSNGKNGKALNFNGNDYISTSYIPGINSNQLTVSAWINPRVLGTYDISNQNMWDGGPWTGWRLQTSGSSISFKLGDGTSTSYDYSAGTISANVWQHVVGIWDGSYIHIYINGKEAGKSAKSFTYSGNTSTHYIGKYAGSAYFFDGLIDDVKIYNYALTAEEVKQDYNAGSAIQFGSTSQSIGGTTTSLEYCIPGDTSYCAPPVAEWKMDEGVGTSVVDTSGNNNTGTWQGTLGNQWSQGKIGKAGKFNGTNNYVLGSKNLGISGDAELTMCAWIKWTGTSWPNDWASFMGNNSTGSINNGLSFTINQGRPAIDFWNNRWRATNALNINQWYYICGTKTPGIISTNSKIFINGQIVTGAVEGVDTTPNIIDSPPVFGRLDSTRWFNGLVDHVKIYNYARTPAQIAYDYNKGGPVGWWKFDECQGNIAYDWSGIGNTGTINIGSGGSQNSLGTCAVGTSAAWTNGSSGKINSSLSFGGVDDYVNIGNKSELQMGTGAVSVSHWIKLTGLTNYRMTFFGGGFGGATGYGIGFQSGTTTLRYETMGSSGGRQVFTVDGGITLNNWHHVTGIFDGINNVMKLYVDGVQKHSIGISDPGTVTNNSNFSIGSYNASQEYFFLGQIDDVRIYNYALTNEQVKQIYNGGAVNFR